MEVVTRIKKSLGTWARSDEVRVETFAQHLRNLFQPNADTKIFDLPSHGTDKAREPIFFWALEIVNAIKKQLKPKKAAERDLITPKIISELICKLFTGITKLGYLKKKMEKVYCYNDTHAWERPHKSLIVQDNKFIIVPVHVI